MIEYINDLSFSNCQEMILVHKMIGKVHGGTVALILTQVIIYLLLMLSNIIYLPI